MMTHGDSRECVGMVSLFSRTLLVGDQPVMAGIVGDVLMHPGHRTAGPAVMLMRSVLSAVRDQELDVVYGFPNHAAEPVMKRVGFRRLGGVTRLTRVVSTAPLFRKRGVPEAVIRVVGPIADWGLRLVRYGRASAYRPGVTSREVTAFDDRFADLWKRARPGAVVGGRSVAYLTWKYGQDPEQANRIFAMVGSSGRELHAYLVFCRDEDSVEIREIIGEDERAVACLVEDFERYIRPSAPTSLVIRLLQNDGFAGEMERAGFRRRPRQGSVYWFGSPRAARDFPALGDPANWLLMLADQDT
jgi:hypothetical protein